MDDTYIFYNSDHGRWWISCTASVVMIVNCRLSPGPVQTTGESLITSYYCVSSPVILEDALGRFVGGETSNLR